MAKSSHQNGRLQEIIFYHKKPNKKRKKTYEKKKELVNLHCVSPFLIAWSWCSGFLLWDMPRCQQANSFIFPLLFEKCNIKMELNRVMRI